MLEQKSDPQTACNGAKSVAPASDDSDDSANSDDSDDSDYSGDSDYNDYNDYSGGSDGSDDEIATMTPINTECVYSFTIVQYSNEESSSSSVSPPTTTTRIRYDQSAAPNDVVVRMRDSKKIYALNRDINTGKVVRFSIELHRPLKSNLDNAREFVDFRALIQCLVDYKGRTSTGMTESFFDDLTDLPNKYDTIFAFDTEAYMRKLGGENLLVVSTYVSFFATLITSVHQH